jgi:hypothetical protein
MDQRHMAFLKPVVSRLLPLVREWIFEAIIAVACGSEDGRSDWSKDDRVAHGWGLVLIRLSLSVGTSGPCGLLLPGVDYCGAKRYHL